MAASRDLRSRVTDVETCPICLELFKNPKSLPCLHTFCLECIEGHCRDKEPGDEVACPLCRQKFNIPEGGVVGRIHKLFTSYRVEARKTTSVSTGQAPCEVCCLLKCDECPISSMFCVDCNQKLCEPCSRPHRGWKGGPHKVVRIGASEVETTLSQTRSGKGDKHPDDDINLYGLDCKMNIRLMCFAEEHQQHECGDVKTVACEFVKQIDTYLETVKKRVDSAKSEIRHIDKERNTFLSGVEDVSNEIRSRGEEMKKRVDAQVNELMARVNAMKTETCKEIENLKDTVEMKLLTLKTFSEYCCELKTTRIPSKPCDVTRAANELHTRATELLQNDDTAEEYYAPTITFTPIQQLDAGHNLIGRVIVPRVVHTLSGTEPVIGVTSLDDELYVLRDKDKEQVEVYNTTTTSTTTTQEEEYRLVRRLSVPGAGHLLHDIVSCKHYRCLYVADGSNRCVHRVELNGKVTKLSVDELDGLSVTSQFTVIVPCFYGSKLLELTTDGKQLREISQGIGYPQHAIQLSNGQFVVCQHDLDEPSCEVCIVDNNDHVTLSYGLPRSALVGQWNGPYYFAVDKDDFIFATDWSNWRLLIMSPTLNIVREIVSYNQLKGKPDRLSLDVDRRRLYVAVDTRVVVIQL